MKAPCTIQGKKYQFLFGPFCIYSRVKHQTFRAVWICFKQQVKTSQPSLCSRFYFNGIYLPFTDCKEINFSGTAPLFT